MKAENPFINYFNETIKDSQVFSCITRDSGLQNEAIERLEDLLDKIAIEKQAAIATANEDYANVLLGCECVITALIAEIRMWLLLKQSQPDEAWNELIAAEDGVYASVRAHKTFAHLERHIERLQAIEDLVFPPQVFMSSGMIVEREICSICERDYVDCEHVKGRPYMGSFCTVTLIPAKIDHVSIVDIPADKRCRVVQFSADGGQRNRMTWKIHFDDRTDSSHEEVPSTLS